MKRKILITLLSFLGLVIVGCKMESADSSDGVPFEQYEITDTDGCPYVVIFAESTKGSVQGVTTAIAPKVKQPEECE